MSFSDETLMAYADGELDERTRREVEQAMLHDPAIADKVRQHKALRSNVFGAFAGTLDEEVPQRLHAAARTGKVIHLDSVRQVRTPPPPPTTKAPVLEKPSWRRQPGWGALAATLVVGVLAGTMGSQALNDGDQLAAFDKESGILAAQGKLERALSQQVAGIPGRDPGVKVGITFLSKDGAYCRSFMLPTTAGLACRHEGAWEIPVLTNGPMGTNSEYRQASSALPAAVLEAIDARIEGKPLDAAGERAAHKQDWVR